ncbi:histidinol dehydrogenase [Maridesulfovibrio sp. FT414]|uniref:histidinol dehydrogenase n=1 Tax=Maridesulfovibrio sp. FT414 TaxID=2979469 RepID=UPI003D807A8F
MFAFPDWIEEFQVEDNLFAEAYEATEPRLRAWLKKTIAQVYGVNAPESPRKSWTVNTWPGGFETEVSQRPLDWTVMLINEGSVSPVRILAALVPALAAGVKNVLAIYEGQGHIPQSVLAAFELAGQEDIVRLERDRLEELLTTIAVGGSCGAVLDMRQDANLFLNSPYVRYWRAPFISSISVCKDEESPDMDALAFAHPDVDFIDVDEDSIAECSGDCAVVPAEFVGEALVSFRTVLAYGQEGCWIWNDFGSRFFRQESIALAVAE